MPIEMNRQRCCCFTGHREDKLQRPQKEVLEDLKREIIQAVEDGFTTFITGMAYGVDIWAGELILELRKKHRDIHLIAAVPFEGFDSHWNESWRKRYRRLLKKADEVNYICDGYVWSARPQKRENAARKNSGDGNERNREDLQDWRICETGKTESPQQ